MGWETRGNGGRSYYYTKRKVNGHVVSTYVGAGLAGTLTVRERQAAQAARSAAAEAEREERERIAEHEAAIDTFCDLTDALVHATLLDAGYHRHHRGEWRKRRG